MITVTCPRCGRSVQARRKFVLSEGGVPCLKCKVRISVTREQLADYPDADIIVTGTILNEAPKEEPTVVHTEATAVLPEPAPAVVATDTVAAGAGEAAGEAAGEQAVAERAPMSVSSLFHNEVWEGESQAVPEKEPETVQQLRKELAEAREYSASAEDILNRFSREKITNELTLLKKIRDAEAQCREISGKLKGREEEVSALHGTIQTFERQVGELDSALAAKVEECRAVHASRDSVVAPLFSKIETLERQAGDLTFMLTSKTGEFQTVISRKDGELEAQQAKIQALENQAGELTAELAAKTSECRSLGASKQAEAEALLKQVQGLETRIQELGFTLNSREETYQLTLSRKEEEIQSLLAKIQEREEQAFKLAVELKSWGDKMLLVTAKEGQLKSLYDSLELNLKKEIDDHQKLLASLRRQLQAA